MAELRQSPVAMPTEELADLVAQMAEAIRTGDSLEGSIEYLLPDADEADNHPGPIHMVQASFRTGNRHGEQGSMHLVGKLDPVTPGRARYDLDQALRSALPLANRRVSILIRALQTELTAGAGIDDQPTLTRRLADAHVAQADAEQAEEDAAQRVPSRVQARDEVCLDPEHCDIPGHRKES